MLGEDFWTDMETKQLNEKDPEAGQDGTNFFDEMMTQAAENQETRKHIAELQSPEAVIDLDKLNKVNDVPEPMYDPKDV